MNHLCNYKANDCIMLDRSDGDVPFCVSGDVVIPTVRVLHRKPLKQVVVYQCTWHVRTLRLNSIAVNA